jgi:hypothetical protein
MKWFPSSFGVIKNGTGYFLQGGLDKSSPYRKKRKMGILPSKLNLIGMKN